MFYGFWSRDVAHLSVIVSQFFDILFFFIFVSLCLSFWEVSVDLSSGSLIASLAASGLRTGPSEASVSVTVFVVPSPSTAAYIVPPCVVPLCPLGSAAH